MLDAASPKELKERLYKNHTMNVVMIIIIMSCLILQAGIETYAQAIGTYEIFMLALIPNIIYRFCNLLTLGQMLLWCPYFLNKRVDNILQKQPKIPFSHKLLVAWVYFIAIGNFVYQVRSIILSFATIMGFDITKLFLQIWQLIDQFIHGLTALSILKLHQSINKRRVLQPIRASFACSQDQDGSDDGGLKDSETEDLYNLLK